MSIKFINREYELKALNDRFMQNKPQFMVIYGRRRIGKTEIIKQFCKGKQYVYYLADKSDDKVQLQKILKRVIAAFGQRTPLIDSWEDFFNYIKDKKFVFVIDEFSFLVESNKAIPSFFQVGWDEYLRDSNIFLIICGSSVSMMERDVLSSKSPIYGRRTGQLRIEPLKFKDIMKFFPKYHIKEVIGCFSILGGIPMYLLEFDDRLNLIKNIKNIIAKDSILYEEPIFLLQEELREPTTYSTILEKISQGATKMNEIAQKSGMDVHKLPKYLGVLEKLRFIEKVSPVTIKKAKTKQTLYFIKDDFFRFWYYYIFPYRSEIEGGNEDVVIDAIRKSLDSFTSLAFEKVCMEAVIESKIFPFNKIGRWWHKGSEIDIVAISNEDKKILFCECKWKDNVDAERVLENLKEKTSEVDWHNGKRKEYFVIFARSFKNRVNGAKLFDLKDLNRIFGK